MFPNILNNSKQSNSKSILNCKYSKISPEFDYILHFDGCSKGNPGISGAGAVIYKNGVEIWSYTFFVGDYYTNNHAEYSGLILGLQQAILLGITHLGVKGDSLLVINQMNGIYKCHSSNIKELYEKAKFLEKKFEHIEFYHIDRKFNKRADQLANAALKEEEIKQKQEEYDLATLNHKQKYKGEMISNHKFDYEYDFDEET